MFDNGMSANNSSSGGGSAIGTPLATILSAGEVPAEISPRPPVWRPARAADRRQRRQSRQCHRRRRRRPRPRPRSGPGFARGRARGRPSLHPASPLARRFAREHGVQIAAVPGTGTHGRALLRDVEAAARHEAPVAPHVGSTPRARELAAARGLDISALTGTGPGGRVMRRDMKTAVPVRAEESPQVRMRRAIAAMTRSNSEIPHYHVGETIDLGAASAWLVAENERRALPDRLLLGVVLVKAVALALRQHPELNAIWKEGEAVRCEAIHVGVAVSLRGGGLIAPALHDADAPATRRSHGGVPRPRHTRAPWGPPRVRVVRSTITVTSLGEGGAEEVYGVIFRRRSRSWASAGRRAAVGRRRRHRTAPDRACNPPRPITAPATAMPEAHSCARSTAFSRSPSPYEPR